MAKYIEYKWGHVVPKYNMDYDMSTYVSLEELEEEFGEDILNADAKEAVLRYLTETKYGQFLTRMAQRSEIWVEIVRDDRAKKEEEKEKKEDERWDEWMDTEFQSFRSDD